MMKALARARLRDLGAGLATSPLIGLRLTAVMTAAFALLATPFGLVTGLFDFAVLDSPIALLLPFTLFVFPAFLEEAFFRGVLIPRDTLDRGASAAVQYTVLSTVAFVAWHPLNALTINPGARALFVDPRFLVIAAALGLLCSVAYLISRSLWVPVVIHWLAILVWVFLLGGRNLVLEAAA
jgi:predicted Abi (CAAX) family protease